MKNYVFKIFYFFVLIPPLLLFNNNNKKRFYDDFIMGGFLSVGFCPVPVFLLLECYNRKVKNWTPKKPHQNINKLIPVACMILPSNQ